MNFVPLRQFLLPFDLDFKDVLGTAEYHRFTRNLDLRFSGIQKAQLFRFMLYEKFRLLYSNIDCKCGVFLLVTQKTDHFLCGMMFTQMHSEVTDNDLAPFTRFSFVY